ncbi:hypothetical protein CQ13_33785 [Bradyrhizobium retamae]|uniref:Uncharacterized protein n=1 Tax=Bradyrhizobium retamae TaxID=1300035 RepID=A0A0R3MGN1_9BRAD|nr:hypothetical protein CQ13_33785 [Bradyrhizobium retamae]
MGRKVSNGAPARGCPSRRIWLLRSAGAEGLGHLRPADRSHRQDHAAKALYIAAGLSGAILHRGGIKGTDLIVAISIDKNAPIFEFAHIGSDANRLLAAPMLPSCASAAAFVRPDRELEEAVTIEVRFDAIVVGAGIAGMPPRYLWPSST